MASIDENKTIKSFYMIGKFATKDEIAKRIKRVEELGLKVTHNWTLKENWTCPKSQQVEQDLKGVVDADIIIANINNPNYHYRGSFSEIGAAIATGKTVYLVTDNCEKGSVTHCFLSHRNIVKFTTFEGLLRFLPKIIKSKK